MVKLGIMELIVKELEAEGFSGDSLDNEISRVKEVLPIALENLMNEVREKENQLITV